VAVLDAMGVLTIVTWLSCGLAAACLTPRNRAARSLLAAAVLLAGSRAAELLLVPSFAGAGFALGRTAGEMAFLGALAAVVATLARFPDGEVDARWHALLVRGFVVAAVAAPLAELVGAPTLEVANEPATAQANPLAFSALEPVGVAGSLVASTEPLWIVVGVVLLGLRWRAGDAERRARLRWPLRSLLLLAVLLVLIVVVIVTGATPPPDWLFAPLFLVALSLFPIALLTGITQRVRALERHLTESRARLVSAEDNARRLLERDIHDGVQQQLVAMLSLVELASHQAARDPGEARRTMDEVADQARTAIRDLRELVRGIRPPVLQDAGLVAALESGMAQLPVDVRLHAEDVAAARWAPEVESAAYFVVKESVTNALKHAPGSAVTVRLTGSGGALHVEVADAGPGFDGTPRSGHGLTGLRDRVESLGGVFTVRSAAATGTVVRATIPGDGAAAW